MEYNHQQQQRYQEQQKQSRPTDYLASQDQPIQATHCPKCGAEVEADDLFCTKCGSSINGCQCPHCLHDVEAGLALCPYCGKPLNTSMCSFCGEPIDDEEMFCSICGNPREGVRCPVCGTLNFRSFCRHCNAPLNELAQQALEKARQHPAMAKARQIAQEMEQLQQQMEEMIKQIENERNDAAGPSFDDTPTEISEQDRQLMSRYERLFQQANIAPRPSSPTPPPPKEAPKKRQSLVNRDTLKKALDSYEAKAAEMQAAFDAMLPDPSEPPEIQRNFLCACLVETFTNTISKERKCMGWVCNYCGCHHHQPSDCCRPELGGKWLYKDVETVTQIKHNITVYL